MTTAVNGYEAFEVMKNQITDAENKNFTAYYDLVVLDLNMPISDGYEACQNILSLYNNVKLFKYKHKNPNSPSSI